MCSRLFIFPNDYQPFLFLLHSLHLPQLFTFFLTLQLPLSLLYKTFPLFPFPHTIWLSHSLKTPLFSHFLSRFSSSPSMASKAKKTSYVLSSDVFLFTCWSGAVWLMEPPSLTYRLENCIPMAEFVSFFRLFSFQVSSLIFCFMCFWPCKCLGFVVG